MLSLLEVREKNYWIKIEKIERNYLCVFTIILKPLTHCSTKG